MFVSLDGTDFRIQEPQPFDPTWYSHKFHSSGLCYEVGLCIRTGHIVWANGGVPCGSWSDLSLARSAYIHLVGAGEMTLADRGYTDELFFVNSRYQPESASRQKQIMARHVTVNSRLKQFGALRQIFRHRPELHIDCFYVIINLVQITIENGSPLFLIE
jgi:hypothetical protein